MEIKKIDNKIAIFIGIITCISLITGYLMGVWLGNYPGLLIFSLSLPVLITLSLIIRYYFYFIRPIRRRKLKCLSLESQNIK